MFNYPNPCDKCDKSGTTSCSFRNCRDYGMFMNTMWKRYRMYPVRKMKEKKRKQDDQHFHYEHPDVAKAYLQNGPCKGCQFELLCDVPCASYCFWWDARMSVLRRKYGGKK